MRAPDFDEGVEDINVSTYPGRDGRSYTPVRPGRVRLQEADIEHVLEASMIVVVKAGAPPRPRTHVGQAGTGNNSAELSQCDLSGNSAASRDA